MSQEAQDFFEGNSMKEDHPNVPGVSGTFVKLADDTWHLPSKNETFTKNNNVITLNPLREVYVSEKALPFVIEALGFDPTKQFEKQKIFGKKIVEYCNQFKGDKYIIAMKAIEFGYQLAQEELETESIQEEKTSWSKNEVIELFEKYLDEGKPLLYEFLKKYNLK